MNPNDAAELSRWYRELLGVPELIRAWWASGQSIHGGRWARGEEPELARALLEEWHGNLGLLTGLLASGLYLVVTDADLKHAGGEESLQRLYELGLPRRTVTVLSGGGGEHLYCTSPVPIPSRPLPGYPGIDIKCIGGMVVVPYSIHPDTGELYEFDWGYGPEDLALVPLPAEVIALYGTTTETAPTERAARDLETADYEVLELLERYFGAHHVINRRGHFEVTRPGKEHGISATVGVIGPGVVHVFSSNWTELPAGTYDERSAPSSCRRAGSGLGAARGNHLCQARQGAGALRTDLERALASPRLAVARARARGAFHAHRWARGARQELGNAVARGAPHSRRVARRPRGQARHRALLLDGG